MSQIPFLIINAFSSSPAGGNPCCVCLPKAALPVSQMEAIAVALQLPATAFLTRQDADLCVRWFTPQGRELEFCGHGALAAGHALVTKRLAQNGKVKLITGKGAIELGLDRGRVTFNVQPAVLERVEITPLVVRALGGAEPAELWRGRDYVAVFHDVCAVGDLQPDLIALAEIDAYALVATAPGAQGVDYVVRFFKSDKPDGEDPVNGASQAWLAPFWAARLNRSILRAHQLSFRGGEFDIAVDGGSVRVAGRAVTVLRGAFH